MPKNIYFIKYGKENSVIRSSGKQISFPFMDDGEEETIYEGRIGNFRSFEAQIAVKLKDMGFIQGLFRKNIAFVAIPNDTSPSDMKSVFDSFMQVGFSEIYLMFEHMALALGLKSQLPNARILGIMDVGCDKIDISLVQEPQIIGKSCLKLNIDKFSGNPVLSESLLNLILFDANRVFEGFLHTPGFQIVLTGARADRDGLASRLKSEWAEDVPVARIKEKDELVIAGLEAGQHANKSLLKSS